MWIVILALLNKTDLKSLLNIPSMFILFSSIISDSEPIDANLDKNMLYAKLIDNKFTESGNNWDSFFWIVILFALIRRLFRIIFKLLWIPFKIAFIYYLLKYFGYDFTNIFNILNNISLGVIDWFYQKIIQFLNYFNNNDNKRN